MGSGSTVPPFLNVPLDGGEWSASCPDRYIFGERAFDGNYKGGWTDAKASLDAVEKRKLSFPCTESNSDCPDRSPSVYRLSYPGSWILRYGSLTNFEPTI
jgi:hypothetical protein